MPEIKSEFVSVYPYSSDSAILTKFLVLKRSLKLSLGDTWQFVHGKIEDGETAVQAAFRELQEETGFVPEFLYNLDPEIIYLGKNDCIEIIPAFAAKMRAFSTPKISFEHTNFDWVTPDEALKRTIWDNQHNKIKEIIKMLENGFPSEKFRIIKRSDK